MVINKDEKKKRFKCFKELYGISQDCISYSVPQKIRKFSYQVLKVSPEKFLRNSQEFLRENSWGISRDYVSHAVPQKIRKISDQVLRISRDFVFYSVLQIICKIDDQLLRFSQEFQEKFSGI